MTSKEALEIIVRKHCVSETDEEDEELEKCYKQVKADLNVLEILKRHLLCLSHCEDEKPNEFIVTCSGEGIDRWGYNKFSNWNINCVSDFRIVKEWLERKENENGRN